MADLDLGPGVLNLQRVVRGDTKGFNVLGKITGTTDPYPFPTTGWRAQLRAKAALDSPVLVELVIDASQGADGILKFAPPGPWPTDLPNKAYWDAECSADGVITYFAGTVAVMGQVTTSA